MFDSCCSFSLAICLPSLFLSQTCSLTHTDTSSSNVSSLPVSTSFCYSVLSQWQTLSLVSLTILKQVPLPFDNI